MILLDTNVISELWKAEPSTKVLQWLDKQVVETLYLSAVTVAELRLGLAVMPSGKRQQTFIDRLEREVLPLFGPRVLPFDVASAQSYASLVANARANGQAVGVADGYIAAIAHSKALCVATRDVSPFKAARIDVVNPWLA
jgi:predicted nucleic acid-binding protein